MAVRMSLTAVAASIVLAAFAINPVATAQSPSASASPSPAPLMDLTTLEGLCVANTPDEATRQACFDVVHLYLLPGSVPVATAGPTPGPVSVPDVRGYAEQDMKYTLEGVGLVPGARSRAYDPEICKGCVIGTIPSIGFVVPPGTTVDYTVSRGPEPTPRPTKAPGVGETQGDPNIRVTVQKVDWNAHNTFWKADANKQWVSFYVRYQARESADYNAGEDWSATDQDGYDGGSLFISPKDAELEDGHLRKGQNVSGWVTFEFDKGVRQVTLTYRDGLFADEDHVWVIKR